MNLLDYNASLLLPPTKGIPLTSMIKRVKSYFSDSIDNDYQNLNSKLNYIFAFFFYL